MAKDPLDDDIAKWMVPDEPTRLPESQGPAMGNQNDFTMPFGVHRDKRLIDIPVHYFDWLLDQQWLKDDLRNRIKSHLKVSRGREMGELSGGTEEDPLAPVED